MFVAHDLALVRFLCDSIAVLYQGELVEVESTAELFRSPQHAHTKQLMLAQPEPNPEHERNRRVERRLRSDADGKVGASWRRP